MKKLLMVVVLLGVGQTWASALAPAKEAALRILLAERLQNIPDCDSVMICSNGCLASCEPCPSSC